MFINLFVYSIHFNSCNCISALSLVLLTSSFVHPFSPQMLLNLVVKKGVPIASLQRSCIFVYFHHEVISYSAAISACEKGNRSSKIHSFSRYLEDHPRTRKWLITMASKSPKWGCSPYKWPKWLVNRGY